MKTHGFTSAFATDLADYLAFKEAMGFYGASRIWYLKQFDAYCTARGLSTFDQDTVEGWVTHQLARCGQHRSWMSYIRDFGRWRSVHRDPGAYVLSKKWKAKFVRVTPYLLTAAQIDAFFTAAGHIKANSPWAWQAVAFFGLMHCCGIRTGEARALRRQEVDLGRRQIMINDSKARRSRALPLTSEVTAMLRTCDYLSHQRYPSRQMFFISRAGAPVSPAAVGVIFNRIWDQAGLPRPAGGKAPRPYDFRHHFAYANLRRWMADGTDTAAMLPYLSAYMGHAEVASTYYYIHTSPDFLDDYANITQNTQGLLPEVGFE